MPVAALVGALISLAAGLFFLRAATSPNGASAHASRWFLRHIRGMTAESGDQLQRSAFWWALFMTFMALFLLWAGYQGSS